MLEASAAQDYETAARYRDNLDALTTVAAKSAVVLTEDLDADVFGFARDDLSATVQQFIVRGGRVRGVRAWTVDTELDVTSSDLVDSIIRQAFVNDEIPAPVVILPELPDDAPALNQWLTALRRNLLGKSRAAAVRLTVAHRGEARRLLDTVVMNAGEQLIQYKNRRLNDFSTRSQALADIQDAIGLNEPPLRIECFDISHLQGTEIVASMVVFEDGLPRKAHYRKFALADARDDTDAMALASSTNRMTMPKRTGQSECPYTTWVQRRWQWPRRTCRVLRAMSCRSYQYGLHHPCTFAGFSV
jgi:excinuclease ABC subunit C